jgi:uncharacterized Fe-S radical SAM superfamily protein PflX
MCTVDCVWCQNKRLEEERNKLKERLEKIKARLDNDAGAKDYEILCDIWNLAHEDD